PNVKEYARALRPFDRIGIITDEHPDGILLADIEHLFGAFPVKIADPEAVDDGVVMRRSRVVDAFGGGLKLCEREVEVFGLGGRAECGCDRECTGWGTPVTFGL